MIPESYMEWPAQSKGEDPLEMPMTRLVNTLLAHSLARLEQGAENVSDPPAKTYRRRKK